jgi:cell surface protein SprA
VRLKKAITIQFFTIRGRKSLPGLILYLLFSHLSVFNLFSQNFSASRDTITPSDELRFPIKENNYPFSNSGQSSPLLLRQPSNIKQEIVYDPVTKRYEFSEKVGQLDYRPPSSMSMNDYGKYETKRSETDYWREKSNEAAGTGPAFMKNLRVGSETLNKIFGTDVISIVPQGSAELIFGYSITKNENPLLPVKSQKTGSFVFKEKIMMNVTGSIGDKLEIGLSYNTEATFDFENKTKLAYSGKEDEIIKKIEAGDITFSLPGSLITGSQSLFGIKTEMQFGKLNVAAVVSRQKGQSTSINVQGGSQQNNFEINVSDYDANRHFFLSHFFRDNYDEWLKNLPYIGSQVKIQQIEVWVVNKQGDFTASRNIVAFMDLGEGYGPDQEGPNGTTVKDMNYRTSPFDLTSLLNPKNTPNLPASNDLNDLYAGVTSRTGIRSYSSAEGAINSYSSGRLKSGSDYEVIENARPLNSREYTLNEDLGYISLNSPLRNDERLAVAYTYSYRGKIYSVGEMAQSQPSPHALVVKLLKGTVTSPHLPSWDLMMKNVYSIDAYQISRDGFVLNVLYRNDKTGVPVNYLSEADTTAMSKDVNNQILLKVLELDNLDSRNEPNPDGVFDFIEGVTVNSKNGRIYFPVLEPFGSDLRKRIADNSTNLQDKKNKTADKYVFQELYDSTQTYARQVAEKNKFMLQGNYQSSSSSDISLNSTNVPKGSVKVTSGGMLLTEGADYTVDYTLGRVKILNQGLLESGTPIKISLESNSSFNMQTKTLIGTHLNYKFSENFNIGATYMHLSERPLTQKVNMGEEPISNTIWGLNTSYRTSSQFITSLVDKIPFINTKAPSNVSLDAEFADLIPGVSKAIGKNGVAYIDDFEASQTKIDLKSYVNWNLGSAPEGQGNDKPFLDGDATGLTSCF